MTDSRISRRSLLHTGLGAAATAGVLSLSDPVIARADSGWYPPQLASLLDSRFGPFTASYDKAYSFLDTMMDAYAQGSTLRLIQSYSDQEGLESSAFTYDNAVSIHAFLVRGLAEDITRAEVIGNTFLYAQKNDSYHDGRLRQAYFVNTADANGAYVQLALAPFYFTGSSTGDMAWTGMALAQLYRRTKNSNYLNGAVSLGNWIVNMAYNTGGAGGYTGGVDANNNPITYKSTEHNIDTYAFFTMLATLTGNSVWATRAQHVLPFLAAMWNSSGNFFWTGTGNDGVTINTSNIPEDVQTWSYLALLNSSYAASIDWAKTNLATIDTPQTINSKLTGSLRIAGLTYASLSLRSLTPSSQYDQVPDPNAVWLEGTAHAAAALLARHLPPNEDSPTFYGDIATALFLLDNIRLAQSKLAPGQTVGGTAITSGEGVVASSSVCNTGFGSSYYPNLHIGATGWYLIAGQAADPFQLGYRAPGTFF